jgi:hypothetical protein
MTIDSLSSSISFRPLISFNGSQVNLIVEHKATKTKMSLLQVPTIVGTKITLTLPNLSTLNIKEMDELSFRVIQSNILLFEYLGYYINGSISSYRQWKQWDITTNNSKEWVTL